MHQLVLKTLVELSRVGSAKSQPAPRLESASFNKDPPTNKQPAVAVDYGELAI
jgi:hypothetical protein